MGDALRVIKFWTDAGPKFWFAKDNEFDRQMSQKFRELHTRAAGGELDDWVNDPERALALILVLDQFSRNLFRDDAGAFAQDAAALKIANHSLEKGFDGQVDAQLRQFFYMPFMHSESIDDQQRCVELFEAKGGADSIKFAIIHRDIIARFGRFPHRNRVLGRTTSPEEQAFLDDGGFSG